MKILTFSPEYPPLQIGGLARHVKPLAESLVQEGHEVTVITQMATGAAMEEVKNGVKILRVDPLFINATDFASHILQINFEMVQAAGRLILDGERFDLIHSHDWLVILAARTLKHMLKIPLILTIHATEHGRNHGIHTDLQRYINDLEWLSCYEAWRVIVCSQYMEREIQYLFQVPRDKVDIIENGVDPADFISEVPKGFKERFAHPNEKVIFFIGRLVQEKGVQVLIDAIPEILSQYTDVKFIIGGKGPKLNELKYQASHIGVANRCYFTGYIDDETRNNLYRICDIAVFPSLYEPFGIVALEAMAARVPVLVTKVGGLGEIVTDGVDGVQVFPGSAHELAQGILRVLKRPALRKKIQENGYQKVIEKFNWPDIAKKTVKVYQRVYSEFLDSSWGDMNHRKLEKPGLNINDKVAYRYQFTNK